MKLSFGLYNGVLIPDHAPQMACALGYMHAALQALEVTP